MVSVEKSMCAMQTPDKKMLVTYKTFAKFEPKTKTLTINKMHVCVTNCHHYIIFFFFFSEN